MLEITELEKKFPLINFGEEYNNAKKQLYDFKDAENKLKNIVKDPDCFIHEYFLKLRNHIDLERELSKKQIDDHFDLLIEELLVIEGEYQSNKTDENYEEIIHQFESDLKRLNNEINSPKIDSQKWNDIKSESMDKIEEINLILENYKIDLLKNQSLNIESIQDGLKDLLKKNFIDKNMVPSKNYWFNNAQWFSQFKNEEGKLRWSLYIENYTEYEFIDTKVELKLINHKTNADKIRSFDYKFIDDLGYGFSDFIKPEDLFDNGFYDKENDCIHCDIRITIKDMKKKK